MVNSFSELIESFGGPAKFARAVRMSAGAAKQAKRRDSLSVEHFEAAARAAHDRGLSGVTVKRLVELAAQRRQDAA